MTMQWFDGTPGDPGQEMGWFDGTPGDPGVVMLWDPTGAPIAVGQSPFDWLEIEIDRCALVYGEAPCQAELGVTGAHKCFNGIATCQDPENYDPAPYWVRFAEPVADLPRLPGFEDPGVPWFLPLLERVRHTPVKPDPGRSIGVRADLRATLRDAPYHDRGLDKYVDDRDFDGAARSSFWLKLLTRHPHYVGRRLRWHRGDGSDEHVTRHYVMERIDGPDRRGQIEIAAKDPLKLADDDRAQAPVPSQGQLAMDMADDAEPEFIDVQTPDTSEYPAGGGIVFIGSEGFTYTSAAEQDETTVRLSGISRSLPGDYVTEADGHAAGDTVQLALYYEALRLVDIVEDLLVGYVPRFDPDWIDKAAWDLEYDTWTPALTLTRLIAEPEGVRKLIDEIVEQTLTWSFWWDETSQLVRYRATRPPDFDEPVAALSDDATLIAGSVERIDEPERVVNVLQVVYGQVDPTADREEREAYRRVAIRVDADSLSAQHLGQQRIRRIFARWHPVDNNVFVDQFTVRTLAAAAARSFRLDFALTRHDGDALRLADFVALDTAWIVDELGLPLTTRMQLLHASADGDQVRLRARRDAFSTSRAFGRLAPGHLAGTTFAEASELERAKYLFLADANGEMSEGSEGYRLL